MPQAMKILDAQAAVVKDRKKLETIPACDGKCQEPEGRFLGSAPRHIDGHVPLQELVKLEPKL